MRPDEQEDFERKQHALDALIERAEELKGLLSGALDNVGHLEVRLKKLVEQAESLKELTDES